MNDIFWLTSQSVFAAMLRIFFIMFIAGFLVRKKIISPEQVAALSKVTVYVLLPSLIFSNNIINFHPEQDNTWWIIPLIGAIMTLFGLGIAYLLFIPDFSVNKDLIPMGSIQNSAYLVLPVVQILYPDKFTVFALFVFLYIIGVNPIMWSIGKALIVAGDNNKLRFSWKDFISPPLVVNVLAIIIVLLSFQQFIPIFVLDSASLLGDATVPMATFVLGATLGGISFKKWPSFINILRVSIVKFVILPVATILILIYFDIYKEYPFLSDFLIIQSAAAPATAIILQVKTYGGNEQKISSMMLITYVICLFAMPFWLAYWNSLIN